MEKPFVVCHMLVSLDGKIDGAFFQAPQTAPALKAYGELRGHYGCAATLYGTATMLGGYADGRVSAAETDGGAPDPGDWVNADGRAMGNFIVSLDPCGELAFPGPVLEKKSRVAAHVVQALTRRAAPGYLAYLRRRGVSYVFAGDESFDCALLLEKLRTLFGIERLMVAGGGITNGSFLAEGLLDELSLVVAPVADGGRAASVFETAPFHAAYPPQAFSLLEARALDGGALWLRYRAQKEA